MTRLLEILFGLERGFLSREGDFALRFNPAWPGQSVVGAGMWNFLLIVGAILLVAWVYRREGRGPRARVILGSLRLGLLGLIIALLNRPVVTLTQTRTEPSVLAVMVDDSVSMRVRDAGESVSRLASVVEMLGADDRKLLKDLEKIHQVKLYKFDATAAPLVSGEKELKDEGTFFSADPLMNLTATGQNTQVASSIRNVLEDLQGQRLAGVVVLTDGRDTPSTPLSEAIAQIRDFNVRVYPVPVGSEALPGNVEIQSVTVQESAFKRDWVNVRLQVRGRGYPANHPVMLTLKDKKGRELVSPEGTAGVTTTVKLPDDKPVEAELQFKAEEIGTLDLEVTAEMQAGETDDQDNARSAQIAILDAQINVLYVEGYPRWEYRYLKNQMMRDKTVNISCLLTSADPAFAQEGDTPITRFPETMEEMAGYDVVIFGDVDPRQFSDPQLAMVNEFVAKRGGGFGMVAGPKWSPAAYKGTAIEAILPVIITQVMEDDPRASFANAFRPVLTRDGAVSSIFRFFADRAVNEKFIQQDIPPLFWYSRGNIVKPGVGEVYAEHPSESSPDGRKAPLLVVGRYGAGRTLFSAIDDSWRWRYYTGESVFDTYWVQQIRYLARSRKLGQRQYTFASARPGYEIGDQVRLSLRILDPQLMQQLPEQLRVDIVEEEQGASSGSSLAPRASPLAPIRQETLARQEGQPDLYVASFPAERLGKFVARLPGIASGTAAVEAAYSVFVPRLELNEPQVDRMMLSRLATETLGQVVEPSAVAQLPRLIPSAAKVIPIESSRPLWDAPLAMALFVLLITAEWVVRKMYGMV